MPFDRSIARLIDHTILRPEATRADVRQVCAEARRFEFVSVCVNPYWVPLVSSELAGSRVVTCTVAGFPLGATSTDAKVAEARAAMREGASEIDMVINIGALLGGELQAVESDIRAVAECARSGGALLKVIIETALLVDPADGGAALKTTACRLAQKAGADFVKTSTGFSKGGATVDDVALMRRTVGSTMGVKASGGIRNLETLRAMVAAGASRIGASASVAIMEATAQAAMGA